MYKIFILNFYINFYKNGNLNKQVKTDIFSNIIKFFSANF